MTLAFISLFYSSRIQKKTKTMRDLSIHSCVHLINYLLKFEILFKVKHPLMQSLE